MYVNQDGQVLWASPGIDPEYNPGDVINPGEGGAMTYKTIKSTGLSEGDVHLTDANWAISKALINQIRVVTNSNNWDMWILQNDNGYAVDDAAVPKLQLMDGGNGAETIEHDFAYEDEDASNEVHLYLVDNSGSDTFDIYIKGVELQ